MNTLDQSEAPSGMGQPLVSTAVSQAIRPIPSIAPATPIPLAYTVEEAAAALHVCPKTIRRLLDRGLLTASKALRKKLIPRSQIEGFLKATCDIPKIKF